MTEQQDNVTSPGDKLNVTPSGDPTSNVSQESGTSADGNIQSAIQKHAELRKQAEEQAAKALEESKRLQEQNAAMAEKLRKEQESRVVMALEGAIKSSRISDKAKETYLKDPVKWFLAYSDNGNEVGWDALAESVRNPQTISSFVAKVEDVVGTIQVQNNSQPKVSDNFIDNENSGDRGNEAFDLSKLRNMSPYEIAKLPSDIRNTLMCAGSKSTTE